MNPNAAVVTGVAVALPGRSDVAAIDAARASEGTVAPVDPGAVLGRRGLRYKDRATQLALCVAQLALIDAGLLDPRRPDPQGLTVPGATVGVVVSSNTGNLDTVASVATTIEQHGTMATSPLDLPNASSNVIASSIAIRFGLCGPNLMICNGPTSGTDALYWATVLTRTGRAHRVVVVGVETGNDTVARFAGVAPGEMLDGAAAVVVEHRDGAACRGAAARATLAGYRRSGTRLPPAPDGPARRDLGERFALASGALGVLQCAAAVDIITRAVAATVLTTTGEDGDDASATLTLTGPAGTAADLVRR